MAFPTIASTSPILRLLPRTLSLCLLALLLHSDRVSAQVPRRRIESFTVVATPLPSAMSAIQVSEVRDVIEQALSDYLDEYPWEFGGQFDFLGLTQITSEYKEVAQQMRVSFGGGLIYFTRDTVEFGIPKDDELAQIVRLGVTNNRSILQGLQQIFRTVTHYKIVYHDTDAPTSAPTFAPSPLGTTTDTFERSPSDPIPINKGAQSDGSGDEQVLPAGALIGVGIAGMSLIALTVLLVNRTRWQSSADDTASSEDSGLAKQMDDIESSGSSTINDDDSPRTNDRKSFELDRLSPADTDSDTAPKSTIEYLTTHQGNVSDDSGLDDDRQTQTGASSPYTSLSKMLSAAQWFSPGKVTDADIASVPQSNGDDTAPGCQNNIPTSLALVESTSFSDVESSVYSNQYMIPVKAMESFEERRRNIPLRKDMLTTPRGQSENLTYWEPRIDKSSRCALAPTDVSAATLAMADREERPRHGFPQFSVNADGSIYHHQDHTRLGYHSSSETDTFGANEDDMWDPDDTSLGTYGDSDVMDNMQILHCNRDEQSLLNDSVRNTSYKMQRLRTPRNDARNPKLSFEFEGTADL